MKTQFTIFLLCLLIGLQSAAQTQLLTNTTFSGSGGWSATGDFHFGTTYSNCPCGTPPCPGYGWLSTSSGNPGNNLGGDLSQTVTLSQTCSSATFSFCWNATSQENTPNCDYFKAFIINNNTYQVVTAFVASVVGNVSGNVINYTLTDPAMLQAGTSLNIGFEGSTDGSLPSTMRVDDATFTVYYAPAIQPPTGLTANATSSSSISLSWNASTGANGYDVYDCSSGYLNHTTNTNYTVNGLTPGTYYSFKVRATSNSGNSGFTSCVGATTLNGGNVLQPPTGLTAVSNSSSTINLTWNTVTGANSYIVKTCSGSSVATTGNTNYLVTGLSAGTYYDYKVQAVNASTSSAYCTCVGTTTQGGGGTPPNPVTGLTATATSGTSISLSWNPQATANYYEISTCSGNYINSTNSANYTVTGLTPGTTYSYKVSAVNQYGNSTFCACQGATTPAPNQFTISVSVYPSNGGTTTGAGTYSANQSIVLQAQCNTGYNFVSWTENGVVLSTNASFPLVVTANRTLLATFTQTTQPNIMVNPTTLVFNQPGDQSSINPQFQYSITEDDLINDKNRIGMATRLIVPKSVTDNFMRVYGSGYKGTLPAMVDYSPYCTPVKDQKTCLSCWAFTAVGMIEYLAKKAALSANPDYSEQELVSCVRPNGCSGGYYYEAFNYIKNHNLVQENCFPYVTANSTCTSKCMSPIQPITVDLVTPPQWSNPTVQNLKLALQHGPIAISMKIHDSFYRHLGGIFNYQSGSCVGNHHVLLVGYNDAENCFKAKNSWGTWWGENGYFRIDYSDVTDNVHFGGYGAWADGIHIAGDNTTSSADFTIQNTGTSALSVTNIACNKSWITFSQTSAAISLGGLKVITVTIPDWSLVPAAASSETITISSNDPDEPVKTVNVIIQKAAGAGTPELIVSTPFEQDQELPGNSSVVDISISNSLNANILWNAWIDQSDWLLSATTGFINGKISVTLPRNNTGQKRTGLLYISSLDVTNSPQVVSITQGTNSAPVIADVNVSAPYSENVKFTGSDFTSRYMDSDGNPLTYIRIINFPVEGDLFLSGYPVHPHQSIPIQEIPNLEFRKNYQWNGLSTFEYNASDGINFAQNNASVIIRNSNGMADKNNDLVNIYPNPTTEMVTLELNSSFNLSEVTISLYNISGQLLSLEKPVSYTQTINLGMYPDGFYIIKIESPKEIFQRKVIKY